MCSNSFAVGVFDSGLGGLTAVKELKKILPDEKIIYFGDTGRVPYGTRSAEIITKYALDDLNFLNSFGVKTVLVACGTVSSVAIDTLREKFDMPITGIVEPAAKKACAISKTGRIAVLATPATVRNKAFDRVISNIRPDASVMSVGCTMFVPLVESGYVDENCTVTNIIADEYISKLKDYKPDVIILGCTHYPIIAPIIKNAAKRIIGDVEIVDSGAEGAAAIKNFLETNGLANRNKECRGAEFYVSDETQDFEKSASLFLGEKIRDVTKIDIADFSYNNR